MHCGGSNNVHCGGSNNAAAQAPTCDWQSSCPDRQHPAGSLQSCLAHLPRAAPQPHSMGTPEKTSSFHSLRRAVRAALVALDFLLRVSSASSTSICRVRQE